MIKVFHGDDAYESYRQARELLQQYGNQERIETVVVDADEVPKGEFVNLISGNSLFGNKKLLLAKRLLNNSELVDTLLLDYSLFDKADLLIWHPGKLDSRQKVVKLLKQQGEVVEYQIPKQEEFMSWIITTARDLDIKISTNTARYLVEKVGMDRSRVNNLVQSASLLGLPQIENSFIDEMIKGTVEGEVWDFLDALSSKNKQKAIAEFQKLVEHKVNDQYLITMMARELWLLAQVVDAQNSGKGLNQLGIHPFVLRKVQQKSGKYSWNLIQKLNLGLIKLDAAIKQGRVEPISGMFIYILSWLG